MSVPTQTEMIAEGKVILRNLVTGSCHKHLDRVDGEEPRKPILDFYCKSDELGELSEACLEIDRRMAQ